MDQNSANSPGGKTDQQNPAVSLEQEGVTDEAILSRLAALTGLHTASARNIASLLSEVTRRVASLEHLQPQYVQGLDALSRQMLSFVDLIECLDKKMDCIMASQAADGIFSRLLGSGEAKRAGCLAPGENRTLPALCDQYGSDKGSLKSSGHAYPWAPHTYTDVYSLLFHQSREHVKHVFECGIGTNNPLLASNMTSSGKPGASLRVWRDFFPNATVYGADIDRDILFEEDRIKTYHVDQTSPESIRAMWDAINLEERFDIMIDDGLHEPHAAVCLFENAIDRLADNGLYIIEDVVTDQIGEYRAYFEGREYVVDYILLHRSATRNTDNNLIVIRNR